MKVIKPIVINNQNMTSNIPEPDPASGEAVYQAADDTVYPMSSGALVDSIGYDSTSKKYMTSINVSSDSRRFSFATSNFAVSPPFTPSVGWLSVIDNNFAGEATDADSFGDVVLVCTTVGSNIYRSADGGATWSTINVPTPGGEIPEKVVFVDANTAICAYEGIAMLSTDAGLSWSFDYEVSTTSFFYTDLVKTNDVVILFGQFAVGVRASSGTWSTISRTTTFSTTFLCSDSSLIYARAIISGVTCVGVSNDSGKSFSNAGVSLPSQTVGRLDVIGDDVYYSVNGSSKLFINTNVDREVIKEVDMGFPSSSTILFISAENNRVICGTFQGEISFYDLTTEIATRVDSVGGRLTTATSLQNVDVLMANSLQGGSQAGDTTGLNLPHGSVKVTSSYSVNDQSMIGYTSIVNYIKNSTNYMQVVRYNSTANQSIGTTDKVITSGSITNPIYGQCCFDGRYIYQLIKNAQNWFLYKVDTQLSNNSELDLGEVNSGYIDSFSSNPAIFINENGLNIPINKSLSQGQFDTVLRVDRVTLTTSTEVTPNKVLTSNCNSAIYTSGETVTWVLDDDTVEITDNINFDSLGGYREGDEVISLSNHRRYRATTNTLDTPEAGSLKTPPTWTDIAPTNKYSAFSTYIHNRTESQTDIFFEFQGVNSDSIALFGMVNAEMLELKGYNSSGDEIYTNDLVLLDTDSIDVFGEVRLLDSIVITGISSDVVRLSVKLVKGDEQSTVAVGRIVVGKALEIGVSQYGASLSIEDFSRRERDEFGNFTISQRSTAKNINFDVKIDKQKVNAVFRLLSELTTIPCVWLGDDEDAALQVYGFYSDYTHNIDYPSITSATISVEGLT